MQLSGRVLAECVRGPGFSRQCCKKKQTQRKCPPTPSQITLKPHMMGTERGSAFILCAVLNLATWFNVSKLKGNQSKEKQKDTLTLPTLNHGFFLFPWGSLEEQSDYYLPFSPASFHIDVVKSVSWTWLARVPSGSFHFWSSVSP